MTVCEKCEHDFLGPLQLSDGYPTWCSMHWKKSIERWFGSGVMAQVLIRSLSEEDPPE